MNGEAPPTKKRTWLWVVLGIFLFFTVLSVGCVVGAVLFFRQSFDVQSTSEQSALQQMDEIRAKFPGQQPLIQMVGGKAQLVERTGLPAGVPPIKALNVMAFDNDEENLVNFTLPWWLIRMKSGPIRISAYQQGFDDRGLSFNVEDIEKNGPGIVADITREREGRVVIWVE